jgi:hypothetical protein
MHQAQSTFDNLITLKPPPFRPIAVVFGKPGFEHGGHQ